MIDIANIMWIVPFCLGMGYIFAEVIGKWNRNCGKIRQVRNKPDEIFTEEENLDPMSLRNGMNVTRCENPTFAEQWVNIMSYNGENQKEEDYGEGKD